LIEAADVHATRDVGHHPPVVARIRRRRHEGRPPQTQQIIGPHQSQHALVIDRPAIAMQYRREPPIAIVAVANGQPL
jgi:hypothetical protein